MKTILFTISVLITSMTFSQSVTMYRYDGNTQQNLETIGSGDTITISTTDNSANLYAHLEFNVSTTSNINFRILQLQGNNCASNSFSSSPIPDPNFQGMDCAPNSTNFLTPVQHNIDLGSTSFLINPNIYFDCTTITHHRYIVRIDNVEVDSFDLIVNPTLSVEEKEITAFEIFPNPGSDVVQLQLADKTGIYSLRITDLFGQIVTIEQIKSSKAIDLSNFQNGIYFITLSDSKGNKRTKNLIVNH